MTFFYTDTEMLAGLKADDLRDDEMELLLFYRKIENPTLQALARDVVERVSDTDIESYLMRTLGENKAGAASFDHT
jgi:hypothetical protein